MMKSVCHFTTRRSCFGTAGAWLLSSLLLFQDLRECVFNAHAVSRPPARLLARLPHSERNLRSLPPHVFAKADDVLQALVRDGLPQAIVYQGITGSGKTEALKMTLQYIINSSQATRAARSGDSSKAALSNGMSRAVVSL
jgi:hypothetical protein